MKERLVIKNFGPIKSVDIELGKMTILIGEQATGKSTIAKVLAVCRYFSFIVDYSILGKTEDQFYKGLRYWEIDSFFNENTRIEFENDDYSLIVKYGIIDIETDRDGNIEYKNTGCTSEIIGKSERFKNLLLELEESKPGANENGSYGFVNDDWYNWTPSENFFKLNVKRVMDNPFFIPTERGLQSLFSLGRNLNNLSDSLLDQLSQLNKIVRGFNVEVYINSLSLKYKNENGIGYTKKDSERDFHTLHNGASGYKSAIPIEIAVYFYSKIEKRKRIFIVEEPEINLFPSAQKKLMEFFVENINVNGHSFLLPTHSPYFLSAINDLLIAYKKGQKNPSEVEKIVKKEFWLNPESFSVYELKNGEAFDIFDKGMGLIADNIIDDASDEMNEEFDELLDVK